eukprot:2702258-Prymnesium_polylepis.1
MIFTHKLDPEQSGARICSGKALLMYVPSFGGRGWVGNAVRCPTRGPQFWWAVPCSVTYANTL